MTARSAAAPMRLRSTQGEHSALSDQRFVAAAIALLAECGVESLTLKAVGVAADYNHSLAVHRYGGKAGLLARVMEHVGHHRRALP